MLVGWGIACEVGWAAGVGWFSMRRGPLPRAEHPSDPHNHQRQIPHSRPNRCRSLRLRAPAAPGSPGRRACTTSARSIPTKSPAREAHGLRMEVERGGALTGHAWEQFELPRLAADDLLLNLCNTGPVTRQRQLAVLHDAGLHQAPRDLQFRFPKRLSLALQRHHASSAHSRHGLQILRGRTALAGGNEEQGHRADLRRRRACPARHA